MIVSTRTCTRGLLVALLSLGAQFAFAAGSTSSTSTTTSITPSSGDDVKEGDNIYFDTYSGIFTEVVPPGGTAPNPVHYFCAPQGYRFVVVSITQASTSNAGTQDSPKPADTTIVQGYFPSGGPGWRNGLHFENKAHSDTDTDKATGHTGCESTQGWVKLDATYQFTPTNFAKTSSQRVGFTWGGMIIPYKYYFTDHSIQGSPSTVAYVGYQGWFPGISLAAVGAAGLGVAQTSSSGTNSGSAQTPATSSSNSTSTSATYTWAVGLVATFGKSIKAGVMTGRDYQTSASGFKYENKQWIALSVGTSF